MEQHLVSRSLPAAGTAVAGIPAEQDERNPAYEAFIPLAVTAGMTKRLKLGTLVVGNPYRNPALVAKMAAEVDQASKRASYPGHRRRLVRAGTRGVWLGFSPP